MPTVIILGVGGRLMESDTLGSDWDTTLKLWLNHTKASLKLDAFAFKTILEAGSFGY